MNYQNILFFFSLTHQNQLSKLMHKIMLFGLCLVIYAITLMFGLFSGTSQAGAEGISLSVSPSILTIQITPPANAQAELLLQNLSDEPVSVRIDLIPFKAIDESGGIEFIDRDSIPDEYQQIFKKILVTDNGIETGALDLGPKQKKTLSLSMNIPKEEIGKDYYFSVVFLAQPVLAEKLIEAPVTPLVTTEPESSLYDSDTGQENQNISVLHAGIAANILLSIGNKQIPEIVDIEFTAPPFLESGPVDFSLKVNNLNNRFIRPKGIIFIKNIFGQTIGRLDIKPDNILAGTTRYLTDTVTASSSSNTSFKPQNKLNQFTAQNQIFRTPNITWHENFLIGPYTADLQLALTDQGPIYKKSIIFIALPLMLTAITALVFIISIIIIIKVRHYIKMNK